jgi:hypothetical protein
MVAHLAAGDMKTWLIVLFVEIKLLSVPRFWQKIWVAVHGWRASVLNRANQRLETLEIASVRIPSKLRTCY